MEYDSESSCEGRCLRDFEDANEPARLTEAPEICDRRNRVLCQTSAVQTMSERSRFQLNPASKSLSSQVMEYYHKYSRNSNLDHYFSLPNASQEAVKYYYSVYELSAKVGSSNRQDCIGEEYNLKSYVPRERRRWVRPPLIGQSSNADTSSRYVEPLTDPQTPSPDLKHGAPETIHEEKHESPEKLPEVSERKLSSPTSSVASYKPLEWDSGADVGYFNSHSQNKHNDKRLSTIERMALARGCSAALRLDPEGTTESGMHSGKIAAAPSGPKLSSIPDANSTPLVGNASGSESEIEITPIVKSHLPGIIAGDGIKSEERRVSNTDTAKRRATTKSSKQETHNFDTPTSSAFKMPLIKYSTTERRLVSKRKEIPRLPSSPLKKSISMNVLSASSAKSSLKRSQSDLNLHTQERKAALPLIFNSTSSIATVVNKPMTCDKVIQTSPEVYAQESVGVQVSDLDESRLPLAEGDPSAQTTIHSILKKSKGTYRVKGPRKCDDSRPVDEPDCSTGGAAKENPRHRSSSGEMSQNASTSVTPQPDETENVSGRANSFEYFPGHTYANVPNGRDSHVSSDTGRSNSTLPNSSSSINEKLWGDSDSLVRDLERSVNILKSLVDANKCDKHVKKRLIQHVIKRLVTAKYTDDRIEHNLEDNVPWNPDDARNKVYRAELLQALAKKHSTTESSDEWNLRNKDTHKSAGTTSDVIKEVVALESSNSDKFDRHTDRTEMDGRKARLGLRTDDCQQSGNTTTDPDKSESSECFVPQRNHKNAKVNDIFCYKDNCKLPHRESTTTNSIPPPDHNRILLDAVVNNRRTPVESNNNTDNNTDWRLPTTSSERQFELKKCSMSESGDSKLVSYAEMEKRNQLIWITNEISHLCNLKKLLEQPRRLERPKSSPRKPKSANFKSKQTTALASRRDQSAGTVHNRNTSDLHDDSVNEPWSSHCNLATCEAASDNAVQRVMKRNSCTQTASDTSDAYSKTGGEIVSACRTRSSATKGVAAGVQTPSQEMHPTPATTMQTNARDTKYTSSQSPRMRFQDNAKCRDQTCQKHTAQIVQCASCARCVNQNSSDTSATRMRKNFQGDAAPNVSQQTQTNYASDNGAASTEPAYRRAAQSNSVQYKQKEAKNQINASKSKCDCARVAHSSVNGDNKYGPNVVVEAKRAECCKKALLKVCPSCSKQKLVVEVGNGTCNCGARENNPGDGKTCARASECGDVSDVANDADGRIVIGQSRQNRHADSQSRRALNFNEQNGSACDCVNDCVACRSPETTAETLRDCRSSGPIDDNRSCHFECRLKTAERQPMTPVYSDTSQDSNMIAQQQQQQQQQQQRKVQSSLRCDEACSCGNNQATKDIARGKACRSHATKPNFVDDSNVVNRTERSCKHCRACGAMYQNARKCDCRQTYPKAVAYELSFTKESTIQNETSDVVPITPKIPFAKQPSNPTKSEACPCDIKRNVSSKNSHQTTTLQDYLSKNNPEFVGNAETRRQYLSEICQLRELRKEKRIQLLAMASTSHIIRSAQAPKPTVCVQRKISEQEMKERLRKRYLRLNEVRFKRRQQERQEEARRNKLMAKIFCKRLQQKVLRGQVDLSQSVSVISNL